MEILSATTLTNIKDGFTNQHLTSIVGERSYATIKKMERELAPNAKSQRKPNSLYGYLQCMTQPANCHALTNENLAIPPDPGDQAAYPAGTDELQRAQIDQTYSQRKIARITYEKVDQVLVGEGMVDRRLGHVLEVTVKGVGVALRLGVRRKLPFHLLDGGVSWFSYNRRKPLVGEAILNIGKGWGGQDRHV